MTPEYRRRLTAFLRLSGELVDRFERLAPGEDGLIRKFRAKRDELILSRDTYRDSKTRVNERL